MEMSAFQAATEAHLQTYQGDLAAYIPPSGHGGLVFAEGAITAVQATVGAWINET